MKKYNDVYEVTDETTNKNITKYTIVPKFKWYFETLDEAIDKIKELNEKQPFIELSMQKGRTLNEKYLLLQKKKA